MKSIFDIENRLDINIESERLINAFFFDEEAVLYEKSEYDVKQYGTVIEVIEEICFLKWKYRDTFLSVFDYLKHIGIDYGDIMAVEHYYLNEEQFLYFLEFMANMIKLLDKEKKVEPTKRAIAYAQNISRILEKMNYKLEELGDKVIITKRDADVDSVLEFVPENVSSLLLEYNDFRIRNDIEAKKKLLKALDLYIENNIKIKEFDSELDNTIGTITNKMGINHPRIEEPYKSYTDEQLLGWYDKCFLMMLHVIRTVEIRKIKKERKKILNNQ